jgi:hypothetical protein
MTPSWQGKLRFSTPSSHNQEGTLRVKASRAAEQVMVTADGAGVANHAGAVLVAELSDRVGLTAALSQAMSSIRQRSSAHDPGVLLTQLAVSLVDGGECVSDLRVLRNQPDLFGDVASTPTASRMLYSIDDSMLEAIAEARAAARARAWEAGMRPDQIVLDFDATLITSHSDKEKAAPNYKHGYGFNPLLCFLDGTGEALAGMLRPGNANPGTAADHVALLDIALGQLPVATLAADPDGGEAMLARSDSAGCSHAFVNALRQRGLEFSIGFPMTEEVRLGILALRKRHWTEAIDQSCQIREGAWVAELTDLVDLTAWPEGTRLIVRKEEPHPGAQFSLFDVDGYRYQACICDSDDADIAYLEARHRGHARVEDRIKDAKDCGLEKFPCYRFAHNQAWLAVVLIACDLLAWTKGLCLEGELAIAAPKRLRYCLLHAAASVVRHARRLIMRLQESWPWTVDLAASFERLRSALM